jgi:hypothetical protein
VLTTPNQLPSRLNNAVSTQKQQHKDEIMFWIGLFVGAFIGVCLMCLMFIARENQD